jgi:hypothetical protein
MLSPFKLTGHELNNVRLDRNPELAVRLQEFFKDPTNDYLWNIHVHRQTAAPELKFTRSINLRIPRPASMIKTTREYNQVMDIVDFRLKNEVDIFSDLYDWIEAALKSTGANRVIMGRVFFSKLLPMKKVDTHTDQGAYFDYFDRFHFIIQAAENEFVVEDQCLSFDNGEFYWFNNHVPHSLINNSTNNRIILIVDARLE